MTGNGYGLNSGSDTASRFNASGVANGFTYNELGNVEVSKIFLPLNFWFCRNPGLCITFDSTSIS